jgi:hypothetical protein
MAESALELRPTLTGGRVAHAGRIIGSGYNRYRYHDYIVQAANQLLPRATLRRSHKTC